MYEVYGLVLSFYYSPGPTGYFSLLSLFFLGFEARVFTTPRYAIVKKI
jgi:hypothetical protein